LQFIKRELAESKDELQDIKRELAESKDELQDIERELLLNRKTDTGDC